jgi:di/tricarboxylate transporter
MSDITIVALVLLLLVVLFIWNRLPVEVVALGAVLVLAATGVLEFDDAVAGFGDPTVLFIASLFVVSEGIDATGVTAWAGQQLIARTGDDRRRLIVLMMLLVALFTAVISVNGAVAALMPMVVVIAIRLGQSPAQLLMPLAFAAHAGSLLALTGTPVHILVSDAAQDAGEAGFGFFSFALVGVPVLAATIAVVLLLGRRVLPDRAATAIGPNLSEHADTLADQYELSDPVVRLVVGDSSPVVGRTPVQIDAETPDDLVLVGAQGPYGVKGVDDLVTAGDVLIVRGPVAAATAFAGPAGLSPQGRALGRPSDLIDRRLGVAEVVVPPRSPLVGAPVFPGMVTESGDHVVLAVQRNGLDRPTGTTVLAVGDTVLLQGTWDTLDRDAAADERVMVVDSPGMLRRQAVPMGPGAKRAIAVLVAMVVLLATGVVPAAAAALLAAGAMILLGPVTIQQAYRSISWTTVVLVAAMIPVSQAVTDSGAADVVAEALVDIVDGAGPYALLLGLFVLTAVLGQLISNMATALIVIPIAVTAATELGISVRPALMAVTIAAAGAFLTPVATPANLMVMGPAGYEFGDYWKLGLPLLLVFLIGAVLIVPVFFPF